MGQLLSWTSSFRSHQVFKHPRRALFYVEEQRYHCATCDLNFTDNIKMERHNNGPLHPRAVEIAEGRTFPKTFYCQLCNKAYHKKMMLDEHFQSVGHAKKVALAEQSSF